MKDRRVILRIATIDGIALVTTDQLAVAQPGIMIRRFEGLSLDPTPSVMTALNGVENSIPSPIDSVRHGRER